MVVEADADSLSLGERDRIARALAMALDPYRQRIVRASLRSGTDCDGTGRGVARLRIDLRPAGVVTVSARGAGSLSAARRVIRQAPSKVARHLAAEHRELLALVLFTAGGSRAAQDARPVPGQSSATERLRRAGGIRTGATSEGPNGAGDGP